MWESTIKINKIQYALGTYNTEEKAVDFMRKYIEENKLNIKIEK